MQAEPGKSTKGTFLGEDAEKSAFQGSWQLFSMVCEPSLIMNYIFDIQFVSYSAYLVPFCSCFEKVMDLSGAKPGDSSFYQGGW